jgi:cell division protease FtsH
LLAVVLPHADPVHKVTIIPRGMALGVTMQLPVDDKHNYTREYLNDQIAILLGGRIAEEITMNGMTFLGREIAQHQDYSEDTAIRIDQEIKRFVTTNYDRARTLLERHRPALDRIAEELLAREVLDAEQVRRIVAGEKLEEHRPAAASATTPDDAARRAAKERPSIVPPLPPLNKPVTQE